MMKLSQVYDRETAVAYVKEAAPLSEERERRKAAVFVYLYGTDAPGVVLKPSSDEIRATVIRMSADLHRAVKEKAAAEECSMAQAIRHALQRYVEGDLK